MIAESAKDLKGLLPQSEAPSLASLLEKERIWIDPEFESVWEENHRQFRQLA